MKQLDKAFNESKSGKQSQLSNNQNLIDAANKGLDMLQKIDLQLAKPKRKLSICHCLSPGCGIGPFIELEVD